MSFLPLPTFQRLIDKIRRQDAIFQAGLSLIIIRWIVLGIVSYTAPEPLIQAFVSHMAHGLFYTGEALLIIAALQLLWRAAGRMRSIVAIFCFAIFSFVLFLSLSDPILYAIIGDRLSPSVLRQFAGWKLFVDTDFWEPVKAYWLPVGTGVSLLLAYMGWLLWTLLRKHQNAQTPTFKKIAIEILCGLALYIPISMTVRPLLEPVEILYARELLGIDALAFSSDEEKARIDALRKFLNLPRGAQWLDEHYPLVYGFHGAAADVREMPDIVLVVVESLRGANFIKAQPQRKLANTPNLDKLAKEGVYFPRFLANGFPSGPGYISISYGNWPHLRKRVVAEFKHTPMDGIAQRLNTLGYRTVHVESNPGFDKSESWIKPFTDNFSSTDLDQSLYDIKLANQAIGWITEHDTQKDASPFFMLYLTKNPHLPYPTPNNTKGILEYEPSLEQSYVKSLEYVDTQLGRVFEKLKSRARANNTVVIVVGDHANFINQQETNAMPVNDAVWTAGIIYGSSKLVGAPRIDNRLGQQADIMPTILALVGDHRPSAAMGRNLLNLSDRAQTGVISIRSGGLRYEEEGGGELIDPVFVSSAPVAVPGGKSSKNNLRYSPAEIVELCETWTFLLENNRVWDPVFLENPKAQ